MILMRVTSFRLLLFVVSSVSGVWKCNQSAEKVCEANFSQPIHVRRLSEAMRFKPMAEYDFHYNCVAEVVAETVDEIQLEKRSQASARLAKRFHDNDDKYGDLQECEDAKKILPGIKEMMFGYNIVTDKYSKGSGHLQVLDVTSRSEFGATVEDPIGAKGDNVPTCYKVPDAFVSQGISVIFTSDSSRSFKATGSTNAEEYRQTKMKSMMSELSVDGSGSYGPVTISAGFSKSESKSNFEEMGGSQKNTRDASSIEYVEEVFEAIIETPEPSKQLLNRWRNLAKLNTSTEEQITAAFEQYFDEVGTHYFLSATLGGKFTLHYVSTTQAKSKDQKEAQSRASCVAMKAGVSVLGKFGVNVENKDCTNSSSSSSTASSASSYMQDLRTHCRGGDAGKCPSSVDKESKSDFRHWRKTLRLLPAPIHGTKRWITSLIDHILQSYGGTGHESKIYERIIREFGNVNDNVEQAANRLKEFRDKLHIQLLDYLERAAAAHQAFLNNQTAAGKPSAGVGAWNLAEGVELIDPKSHLGWYGRPVQWGHMEFCPGGEFAKAAAIDIQVTPFPNDQNDWAGLTKVNLFCTNGKRLESSSINYGQTSKQVTCPGYLIGYRMRAHQIQGLNAGDDRGATNIEYRCMVEGSGEIRTLKMVVECKREVFDTPEKVQRCEDEQKVGDWGEWRNCPDKYGIAGLKTRFAPFHGDNWDDAAIIDVGYWCNKLPENGLTAPPPNTTAIPCERKTDLVIALDTSTSILPTDFEIGCDFAARLAGAFLAPSRISFITFSDQAKVVIPLDNNYSPDNIHGKIKFYVRTMGGTLTHLAINEAVNQLHTPNPGVPRKLVVITDGISNQQALTEQSASAAKAAGILLFSVGIGSQTRPEELMVLAGGDKDRRFSVDDFDKLLQIIAPVSVEVCDSK